MILVPIFDLEEWRCAKMMKPQRPDKIFVGFRIATMSKSDIQLLGGSALARPIDEPYGAIEKVVIGVKDQSIIWMAKEEDLPSFENPPEIVQGNGRWLTPGLIDCHTHLVYGGNRANEWEARLNGKTYEEIARSGGGILSSVKSTRAASENDLLTSAERRLKSLMAEGVTTVEIKSGYGLDTETELKMLRVAGRLEELAPIDVETTLLGAHALPIEFKDRPDEYIDLVCNEMIPAASEFCTAVDVFCESIAFDVRQSKRVFESALDAGLKIKVHAEQLSHMGIAAEAAKMGAISADHLEYLTSSDCKVLAEHGTVATLLPGAFYCLNETQKPPIAALKEYNVPIAIATDSNPGSSPFLSLLVIGNMACNLFSLTPEDVLAGMTRNAALALGLKDRGEIRPGAKADFAVWDVDAPGEIFYEIGGNPCVEVYKNGIKRTLA
jgi:imidazolonepropionase